MAELINRDDSLNEGRKKLNNAIEKVGTFQDQINTIVVEGDSSVEAAQARIDADNNTYPTLKARLDSKETEISSQLAQIMKYDVYSESDIETAISSGATSITLKRDITITKPINLDFITMSFDLNGFQINLSDSYTSDYIFSIGADEVWNNPSKKLQKHIHNGRIDCNDKLVWVVKYNFSWDFKVWDLKIYRCGNGFIGYSDWFEQQFKENGPTGLGAEMFLDNITIEHSGLHINESYGFDIRTNDGYFSRLVSIYFRYGIRNMGYSNTFQLCHPWGLPRTSAESKRMKIGFINRGGSVTFINCYADTPEPLNDLVEPSYENGGIGFYSAATNINMYACTTREHPQSTNKSIIPFYFDDEWQGSNKRSNNIYMVGCFLNRDVSKRLKSYHYVGDTGITLVACSFDSTQSIRNYNTFVAGHTIFQNPANKELSDFTLKDNDTFKLISDDHHATIVYRDSLGTHKYFKVFEQISPFYTYAGLQSLRTKLIADKNKYGNTNHIPSIYTVLRTGSGGTEKNEPVFWLADKDNFYRVADGTPVFN